MDLVTDFLPFETLFDVHYRSILSTRLQSVVDRAVLSMRGSNLGRQGMGEVTSIFVSEITVQTNRSKCRLALSATGEGLDNGRFLLKLKR